MTRIVAAFVVIIAPLCFAGDAALADGLGGPRYLAVFANGDRVEGDSVVGWHDRDSKPMLDSTALHGDQRTLRWFRNRSPATLIAENKSAGFVEFVGGDRLPGRVVGFVSARQADSLEPAHLLVETAIPLDRPNSESRRAVRVLVENVRRVNWVARSGRRLAPNTLVLRSGGRIAYRSLMWAEDSVRLLTEQGVQRIAFLQIAEIHLPPRDPWTAYFQTLAVLSPDGVSRLEILETTGGLVATGSEARFDATVIETAEERQQRERATADVTRLQQRRGTILTRQKDAAKRHDQKIAEFVRKDAQNKKKREDGIRNLRKRLMNQPEASREKQIKAYEKRMLADAKRISEQNRRRQADLLKRQTKLYQDQLRKIDTEIARAKKKGFTGHAASRGPDRFYHMTHPAWSIDPLWIRFDTIRTRRLFAPHEVPLTMLRPVKAVQQSTLGAGLTWQSSRNVYGRDLRAGGREFGWGFGVHATNELHFELPGFARSFRSHFALDEVARAGGCVEARVQLNGDDSDPLYRSQRLIGSDEVRDTGWLDLRDAVSQPKTLVLVVDAAAGNRPPGADPLDIRDHFDWLEPVVQLDPVRLKSEIKKYVRH